MRLSHAQIMQQLPELNAWALDETTGKIYQTLQFDCFASALAFFAQLGALAEAQDHHPEVYSSYTHMKVQLCTHDVGGLSQKDFDLAKAMDALISDAFANHCKVILPTRHQPLSP